MILRWLIFLVALLQISSPALTQPTGSCPVIYNLPAYTPSSIKDNVTTSSNIYQVNCSDPIDGDAITFLLSGVSPNNPVFQVNSAGLVYYDVSKATGSPIFNYYTASSYNLTITCYQAGFATVSYLIVPIYHVYQAPTWQSDATTVASVDEGDLLPTIVFTNTATDVQSLQIYYQVKTTGPYQCGCFRVDTAGRVYLTANTSPNATWASNYYLNEYAYNNMSLTSTLSLTVTVIAVTHTPRFTNLPNMAYISESTTTSVAFFQLAWTNPSDPELQDSYSFSFTTTPADGIVKFSINSNGQVLTLPEPSFSFNTEPLFYLTIFIVDSTDSTPTLSSSGTLTVFLISSSIPPALQAFRGGSTGTTSTSTSTSSTTTESTSIDTDTLVGIIVGCVGGAVAIAGLGVLIWWCMRSGSSVAAQGTATTNYNGYNPYNPYKPADYPTNSYSNGNVTVARPLANAAAQTTPPPVYQR